MSSSAKVLFCLAWPVALGSAAILTHGPIVGHTTHESTRIWVRTDQPAELRVRLTSSGGRSIESKPTQLLEVNNYCGFAVVQDLQPKNAYTYEVLIDGAPVPARGRQRVMTFQEPGSSGVVRIGFGHSVIGSGEQIVWSTVAAKEPDLFVLMGDNIYSNSTEPDRQRRMYLEYRADPHFQALAARTPVYAVWDDHDYGKDNSDRTQPGKERSLATFHEIWPNPPAESGDGGGIWSRFRVGDSEFFLLDVRYHRSPDADLDGPAKTMLGAQQREWFVRSLARSDAAFKFLVSGSSWNCGGVEAWNHAYLHEYDEILAASRAARVEGIILLGGDQHRCAIGVRPRESWDGYDLHEWMAGRLHAGGRKNQIEAFGMITVDTTAEPPAAKLEFFDLEGRPYEGRGILYTSPGALRSMWDSPAGSMGTPPRSADGEIRPATSGLIWDALPRATGETLTLDDLRFPVNER